MVKNKIVYALLLAGAIIGVTFLGSGNLGPAQADTSSSMGLNEQVSALEQEVLSKTYPEDPLPVRVSRLEDNIIPKQKLSWQDKPLPDRINHLVSIIPISAPTVVRNQRSAPLSSLGATPETKHVPTVTSQPNTVVQSPEEQRFEQAKQQRRKDMALVYIGYIASVTQNVSRSWQASRSPAQGTLLVTKVKVSVDGNGKLIAYEVVTRSASSQEDRSIEELMLKASFPPLPAGLERLELFWTFMSDGSLNILEYTESPEADKYNMELLGVTFKANGVYRMPGNTKPVKDVDYGPYMADLQRRIKRAWFPPKGFESKRVVTTFKIHRGGELSDLQIDQTSGVVIADQAALKAVENASPFRPLPEGGKDEVDIQFVFDYNVYSGGGHGSFRSF